MTKHKTLHFFWAAFPLCLLILLLQVMPALAQRAAGKPDSVDTWSGGPSLPGPLVRAVGVFFPANGHFYAVGGRSSDVAGSDSTNPFDYDPGTNTWTTATATFPDNHMNNMACGVLTVGGTPQIYCVGGSMAGGTDAAPRVFTYNPVTNTITTLPAGANWPGVIGITNLPTVLPGGFTVYNNKLYILGGFDINQAMTNKIWEFTPGTNTWVQKASLLPAPLGYIPTTVIGNKIYTAGGSNWDGTTINDQNNAYVFDPVADTISAIAVIPRATAETRALNVYGLMWVMGGGRNAPNPSNEVDIYNPYCNSWTISSQPFVNARRNFPTDTDGVSRVWLAGGYEPATPATDMEIDKFPMVTSAVSRKVHGGAGTFDVPLPLNGPTGIECRIGPTYTMVVTFSTSVTVASASVTCGTGSVGSISGSGTPTITVNLTGVTNVQRITVTLSSVSDGTNTGDVPISMGVLVGDTTDNGVVNAGDVAQTKSQVGHTVTNSNFREDVNVNGTISSTDVALVKSNVGHSLP
ncbi:MAG TPA: kelch repeat-containing protein [Chthoniobacterales bacterium]|jgi:hypothetical protein|nr:kelch repeat-containing protein [Chthoniobacterales bacterium]